MAKRDWKPKAESIPFSISTQSYPPWAQPPDRKSWSKMKLSISWPMINHDSPLIRQCKTNKEPVGDKLRYVGDAWEITRRKIGKKRGRQVGGMPKTSGKCGSSERYVEDTVEDNWGAHGRRVRDETGLSLPSSSLQLSCEKWCVRCRMPRKHDFLNLCSQEVHTPKGRQKLRKTTKRLIYVGSVEAGGTCHLQRKQIKVDLSKTTTWIDDVLHHQFMSNQTSNWPATSNHQAFIKPHRWESGLGFLPAGKGRHSTHGVC